MDDTKTVWCGNLSDRVTEKLLYELFLQAAPLERVKIPTDREGRKSNFAFITFKHEVSVNYVLQLLNGTKLFDKPLNVKPRTGSSFNKSLDQNAGRNDFQNDRLNQARMDPIASRYDQSPNRFFNNRSGHGAPSFRDREDRFHDWNHRGFHQHDRKNDSPNRRRNNHHEGRNFNGRHGRRNDGRYY